MGRWSNGLLILCGLGAFLLPLGGRWLIGEYQSLSERVSSGQISRLSPGNSATQPPKNSSVAPASWNAEVASTPAERPAAGTGSSPVENLSPLVLKIAVTTVAVLGLCIVSLQLGGSYLQPSLRPDHELQVCESLQLSKEASVKLIRVGKQKVVVTHDRQGVRGMVLLPSEHGSPPGASIADRRARDAAAGRQSSRDRDEDPTSVASLRRRLANSEEHGWDLNRPTS